MTWTGQIELLLAVRADAADAAPLAYTRLLLAHAQPTIASLDPTVLAVPGGALAIGQAALHVLTAASELDDLAPPLLGPILDPVDATVDTAARRTAALQLLDTAREVLDAATPDGPVADLTLTRILTHLVQARLLLTPPADERPTA